MSYHSLITAAVIRRLIIAIFIVSVVAGLLLWNNKAPDALVVDITTVESGSIVTALSLTGELVNDRIVTITALVDGEITDVKAREGDIVKCGATLAEQDPVTARALLEKARAEQIIARVNAEDAKNNFDRTDRLWRRGDMSEQLYDEARHTSVKADSSVTVAKSAVTIAARAVRDATIRAPFDGQVIEQTTETGQWVEAGTPLFVLVATTGQVIEAYVDATDIASVDLDQAATMNSDAWPAQPWQSKVDWIAPVIATQGRSRSADVPPNAIAIRLPLGDEAPTLRLGQQVDVELETARRDDVLKLPLTALRQNTEGEFEVLTIESGEVQVTPVQTGLITPDMAEIADGLNAGDEVIISDVNALQAGTAVTVR